MISLAAFEIMSVRPAPGLEMADGGLDGGASAEFAFDGSVDTALLAGAEDAALLGSVWPRYSLST